MHQTVPRTICFHMIARDWHFWTCIAKLTFGKLAIDTSPYMSSHFALQELSATSCGVFQSMFLDLTVTTSEYILGISRGSRLTMRALSVNTVRFGMPQFFWIEIVLWPFQLSIVRRTAL